MASSPGDFTGKQKEALAKQHAEEQQKRAGEMAMVTAAQEVQKNREVVDYTKAKPEPAPPAGPVDLTVPPEEREGDEDPIIAEILAEQGDQAPSSPLPFRHPSAQPVAPSATTVEREAVLVRARYDLEQVTIGHGNTYDFEEGRQYKVPPNVANHLAERALVDVLQ